MSKMSDARALQMCLVLTKWSTNSAVDVCEENQYWDAIQERCSGCEGICQVYDRTIHKDCRCICFPENRECKGKEFDPSGLATKSDVSRHETWLIILTVLVLAIILWILLFTAWYKKHKTVSRSTEQKGENNTQGDAAEISLIGREKNHRRNREGQPDNPDIPEETEPKRIVEPGRSSADPPTGINNVQEEGPNKPQRGLAGDMSYNPGNPRRENKLESPSKQTLLT